MSSQITEHYLVFYSLKITAWWEKAGIFTLNKPHSFIATDYVMQSAKSLFSDHNNDGLRLLRNILYCIVCDSTSMYVYPYFCYCYYYYYYYYYLS